eukprot:PLAT5099.1.p1 GENE.PLAT5099.1~~PLAT5099.1.p1  ORF type:complete len:395 (+),score=148.95 PLAT5099.1:133-1317(+)
MDVKQERADLHPPPIATAGSEADVDGDLAVLRRASAAEDVEDGKTAAPVSPIRKSVTAPAAMRPRSRRIAPATPREGEAADLHEPERKDFLQISRWMYLIRSCYDMLPARNLAAEEELARRVEEEELPADLVARVWSVFMNLRTTVEENEDVFRGMLVLEGDYPCERDISVDVHRTFPHHALFQRESEGRPAAGERRLFRVLKAYSRWNPEVGYCQGMNFVAGSLLLAGLPQEDAFWMLDALMEQVGLAQLYTAGLPKVMESTALLQRLLEWALPRVADHLADACLLPSMFGISWFATLFLSSDFFCYATVRRIMTIMIARRDFDVLLRAALAIFVAARDEVCAADDNLFEFLKTFDGLFIDQPQRFWAAFAKTHLPRKRLAAWRAEYAADMAA